MMSDEYLNTLPEYKLTERESGKKAAPADKKKMINLTLLKRKIRKTKRQSRQAGNLLQKAYNFKSN